MVFVFLFRVISYYKLMQNVIFF